MIIFLFIMTIVNLLLLLVVYHLAIMACRSIIYLSKVKFELKPGESISIRTIKFTGATTVSKAKTEEPLDQLTVLEYNYIPIEGQDGQNLL